MTQEKTDAHPERSRDDLQQPCHCTRQVQKGLRRCTVRGVSQAMQGDLKQSNISFSVRQLEGDTVWTFHEIEQHGSKFGVVIV